MASEKSHQAVCEKVAEILRSERERLGLSMNEVAQRAGLSQQMISYVERGMRNPTLETLLRISAALGIDLPRIISRGIKESGSAR